MRYFKLCFLTVAMLLITQLSVAQSRVSGTVTDADNGEPLIGATVQIKGTTNGAVTDLDGRFELATNADAVLVFSFTGYTTQEVVVGNRTTIDVSLETALDELDEVLVVGYGTSTTKELTGAVSKVGSDEIMERNVPRVDQALQGQLAGVTVSTNSGAPGGTSNIRIRGISTNGDGNPLILVDGVVYDAAGLNALNPADIKSVNVLKDATAGIYGVRAANGVILIETKQGTLNSKPTFEVGGYYGVQQAARKLDLLNAEEYAILKNEAFVAGGQSAPFANTSLGDGADWQDEVFETAPMQNYHLSVSGGSDKTTYSIGGSYFMQDGIVGGDKASFDRYNGRLNIQTNILPNLKLTNVLLYTNEQSKTLPVGGIGSILYSATNAPPTESIRVASEGNRYSYLENVSDIVNPLALIDNTYNWATANKFVGKEELAYEVNDNFTLTGRAGYNYAIVESKTFNPLVWYGAGKPQNTALNEDLDPVPVTIGGSTFDRGASVYESTNTYLDYNFEAFLNYNASFGSHNVKATLGTSYFGNRSKGLNGTGFNIPNNSLDLADISASNADGGYLNQVGSFQGQSRLISYFIRAEYDYEKRYIFSAVLRRDGSTRFGSNNRIGYFPSFSGAWVISEESFFTPAFIDFAKIRTSYGVSGSDRIGDFRYRAALGGEGDYVFDDVITNGVAIGAAGNPDLKWETTEQFNVGLDLSLLQRFDLTTNYFVKNTKDLLFQPAVSAILGTYGAGGFPPYINGGNVRNRGFEFELGYQEQLRNGLSIGVNANLTLIDNEVTEVPEGFDFIPGEGFGIGGAVATRFQRGYPIGYFIGYETDGVWQSAEEIATSDLSQPGAQPGDLRFVDQNGDDEISFGDDLDRTIIGSPIPDYTVGLNINLGFKGLDFSANIYGAFGQDIIRNYERQQPLANQLSYNLNRWTGAGSTNEYPRLTTGATNNTVFSDFYVEDGSFVRLRNVTIGYTLPANISQYIGAESFRLYVSANNLLTFTKYLGYDPDVGSAGTLDPDDPNSPANPLSAGVDNGAYPQARVIMGGFNIKF